MKLKRLFPWKENRFLRGRVKEFDNVVDIMERQFARERMLRTATIIGTNRAATVKAIIDRYEGRATYGNVLVKRIVNLLAAYQLGGGVELVVTEPREGGVEIESRVDKNARGEVVTEDGLAELKEKTEDLEEIYADELEFCRAFMDVNNLSEEKSQELAKEKEFSGQLLLRLYWSERDRMVRLQYIAWDETRYEVFRDDRGNILRAEWTNKNGKKIKLQPEEFVFMRWNGRINGTTGSPTLAGNYWLCDNIEKAVKDLREGNHYFGYPTLAIRVKEASQAEDVNEQIKASKWQIGQAAAFTAEEIKYLEITGQAAEAVIKEITTAIRLLCGGAGINPHFLGWPDLLSNRAAAEDMENPVVSVAASDVEQWIGGYEELFAKATVMYNRNMRLPRDLIPGAVMATIVTATQVEFQQIKDVWFPLRIAGEIDQDTFLSKLPGVKADQVKKNLEAEQGEDKQRTQQAVEDIDASINASVKRIREERVNATG